MKPWINGGVSIERVASKSSWDCNITQKIVIKKEFFYPNGWEEKVRVLLPLWWKVDLANVCKTRKVYFLLGDEGLVEASVIIELGEDVNAMEEKIVSEEESPEVSIHAIFGCPNNNAMRLVGRIGGYCRNFNGFS